MTNAEQENGERAYALPWCAHKFVIANGSTAETSFQVNHALIAMPGEVGRWPLENGATIEEVEANLPGLGAVDDSEWIIEQRKGTASTRPYWIRHTPATPKNKICPDSGTYESLEYIASWAVLSTFVTKGTCESNNKSCG
jgi:hypothetical protein